MTAPIKLFDRSRTTTDWKCRRRRYWNYEHGGVGIVSGSAAYELFFGTVIHDATATIAQFHVQEGHVPIDNIVVAGFTQVHDTLLEQLRAEEYALEQAYLAAGLIRGFYNYEWPRLLKAYPEIVVIEQEVVWKDFMCKPDLIMRSDDDKLVYVEYKTTASKNDKWVDSWEYNPQLHSYMKAIKEQLGLEIEAAQVIGLYKGSEYKGKQNSPFCYAYHRPANPPFTEADTVYEWKAGYKKYPVWEIDSGDAMTPSEWVDAMPTSVLAEQFVEVPLVYLNDALADTFFRQARLREQEISMGLKLIESAPESSEALMDAFFSQNLEACKPGWGSPCPYHVICRGDSLPTDERWQARQPHHAPEIEAMKE